MKSFTGALILSILFILVSIADLSGQSFSFGVFADNLNRLVSENKTSNAITLIDGFSKTMSDIPRDLGWTLQSAYNMRGTVDELELERASEQTAQIQTLLESMITGTG